MVKKCKLNRLKNLKGVTTLKNKTNLLAILLVFAMFVFVLAGCSDSASKDGGSKSSEDDKTEISFWVLFDGADADTMRGIVEDYNSTHPNHTVNLQFQDNAQYYTKLKTSIVGGTGPDLAISHIGGNINGMVNDQILLPLDDEASRLEVDIAFDKYSPDPTKAANINGKQYAVPLDNLARVLMYNKSILKDAGLLAADGKPSFTVDYAGFTGALQKIKDSNKDVTPLAMTMKPPQLVLTWLSFYSQLGGEEFLSLKDKKATFDEAKAAEALENLHQIYANYVPEKLTDPAGLDMFKAGKSAFFIDGTWSINSAAQQLEDNFGVMGFPYLFGDAEVTTSHSFILPINESRTDAETKSALEFAKWFGENNSKWAKAGHVPAFQPSQETNEYKDLPFHPSFVTQDRKFVALPVIPGTMLHTAPEVKDSVQLAVFGEMSAEEAVYKIKKDLNNLIPQLVH